MTIKKPKILHLNVKKEWWTQSVNGLKTEEYREINDHWKKRLEGKEYDLIYLKLGYPSKTDFTRIAIFNWEGFSKKQIKHPHFGNVPKELYAIDLSNPTDQVKGLRQ